MIDFETLFSGIGKLATSAAALGGGWWAFERWRKRDEHFPRIKLEADVNFLGLQGDQIVCELVARIENRGVVPLRFKEFDFVLRGLSQSESIARGGAQIRNQINFSNVLERGQFVPDTWEHSFIYPGIQEEYNFVTAIPKSMAFVRMQADLVYLDDWDSHHAARVLKVPRFSQE